MRRGARLLLQLRPYTLLFVTNIVATLVASVMDGATFVLLIPFLRALFGQQALPATGTSGVEDVLAKIAGPFLAAGGRSEEHTSELQSRLHLVCRLLLEKKKKNTRTVECVNRRKDSTRK